MCTFRDENSKSIQVAVPFRKNFNQISSSFPILLIIFFNTCLVIKLNSQGIFYFQKGTSVFKIENFDPSKIKVIEWQVRLYKNGASTSGNSYWGKIKGNTANEVMSKLKDDQEFELNFNAFIGKGRVPDDNLTYFNPLGPIAIIDDSNMEEPPSNKNLELVSETYEKAKSYYNEYKEVEENIGKILNPVPSTPFDNVGNVLKEYVDNLKDAYVQIASLRKMLEKNIAGLLDKINKDIVTINSKLDAAKTNHEQLKTAINSNINTQSKNNEASTTEYSGSIKALISNVPDKFKSPVLRVIDAGIEISQLKASIPDYITTGLDEQQIIYFKKFVEDIYYYITDMTWCFALLSPGSIGYGYLNNNLVLIDITDKYYRDNVLRNADILLTDNYNSYYSRALLEKANAAYDLFKLIDTDHDSNKQVKNNLLHYSLANANMIYQQAVDGYEVESVLKDKQSLISKLRESLK